MRPVLDIDEGGTRLLGTINGFLVYITVVPFQEIESLIISVRIYERINIGGFIEALKITAR